jgi:hypothetical protein
MIHITGDMKNTDTGTNFVGTRAVQKVRGHV